MLKKTAALCLLCFIILCAVSCTAPGGQKTDPTEDDTADMTTAPTEIIDDTEKIVDTSDAEYTYDEMTSDLDALCGKYPGLLKKKSIGTSLDGRTIYAAVIGDEEAGKQLVIHAGIHGREYFTSMLVMKQIEYYLDNYKTGKYNGKTFEDLFSGFAIYVVPMANPDGIMIAQKGAEAIRDAGLRAGLEKIYRSDIDLGYIDEEDYTFDTYLKYWKANAGGVDLNRNFDAFWDKIKLTPYPCFRNYKGESPASEPETKASVGLIDSLSDPVCVVCVHSQGDCIYWNCGLEKDSELYVATKSLATYIKNFNNYYLNNDVNNDASLGDWCEVKRNIPAVTVEVGDGGGKSLLGISAFDDIWNDNRLLWAALADYYS